MPKYDDFELDIQQAEVKAEQLYIPTSYEDSNCIYCDQSYMPNKNDKINF